MATRYWEGGGTDPRDLADATNWSGNTLPATGDTAIIADSPSTETAAFYATATLPASGTITSFRVGSQINRNFGVENGVAATATITIDDYTEFNDGDKANLVATDTNNYDFTAGAQSSVNSTFEATTSNAVTAANLATIINSDSGASGTRFTATSTSNVVTITQATVGFAGNTAITITETGGSAMSKTDFTGGITEAITLNATTVELSGQGVYQNFLGTQTTVNVNDGVAGDDMLHLGGTVTNLNVLGSDGRTNVDDSATATNIKLIDALFAEIVVGTSVENDYITMSAGKVTTSSDIDVTAEVAGGTLVVSGSATCVTMNVHANALVQYQTSGTLTTVTVYGGILDFSTSTASSVTITNCNLYEGALIDERSGLGNVVYTNGIVAKGGSVLQDLGRTLTIS